MHTISFPKLGIEFQVNPTAFSIGSVHIAWYGIIIAVAILLAMWMAFRNCKRFGVNADKLVDVVFGGLVGGVLGARIYYVAFSWDTYKNNLSTVWHTWEGGMAIYGGIIGAFLVGGIIAKLHKMRVLPVLDLCALGFLIGQGIGRWGNLINGEAFGCNTDLPWGMTGDRIVSYLSNTDNFSTLTSLGVNVDATAPVHPCFLYESLWCLLGFAVLYAYSKRRRFDGEIFLMYLGWYSFERMFVEGLRTDSLLIGRIRVSQLLSGVLFVACLLIWIIIRSKIKSAHDDEYLRCYAQTEQFVADEAAYAELQALKADKAKWKEEKARRKAEKKAAKGKKVDPAAAEPADEAKEEAVSESADEAKEEAGSEPVDEAKEEAGSEPADEAKEETGSEPADEAKEG
jgi:phosphatidylglycerol:prolipoprotein diacylglycerol transferase